MNLLLVVNPTAGGGRCGQKVGAYVERLQAAGVGLTVVETEGPGHAARIAAGTRTADGIVAVGGDGTLHEVVNGVLSTADPRARPAIGVLPLGTGNSFARDFGQHRPEAAFDALVAGATRPIDALRLAHGDGALFSINLISLGFTAEVGALTNRRFKPLGALGYVAAVFVCVARLGARTLPHACDAAPRDDRPAVLLSFSNSRFTGGQMEMAPAADPADGLLDVVRVGPMGRARLLSVFPRIFRGTHVTAPEIDTSRCTRVAFDIDRPVDVMIDGEVLSLVPVSLEVLPAALRWIG